MGFMEQFFFAKQKPDTGVGMVLPNLSADPETPAAGFRSLFPSANGYKTKDSGGVKRRLDHEGNQTFKQTTKAQITSNQNNYDTGEGVWFVLTSDAARTLTGILGSATTDEGREVVLFNNGSFTITLAHQSASSSDGNRLAIDSGADLGLGAGQVVRMVYHADGSGSRWRVFTAGGAGAVASSTPASLKVYMSDSFI